MLALKKAANLSRLAEPFRVRIKPDVKMVKAKKMSKKNERRKETIKNGKTKENGR